MIDHLHESINCAGAGRWSVSKQWRFCPALFFSSKNCDTMKRKYFNDSSICWRIIGETRVRRRGRNVREVGEVKGTIKTMGKELSAAFDWALIVSFQGFSWPMNSLSTCFVCCFHRGQCYLVGAKIPRLSDHRNRTGQRLCTRPRHRLIEIPHTARIMANGDQLYHDLVYMSAQKRRWDFMIFMKIMSMSNPGYKRRIWPWAILREPLTRITICQVIPSLMRRGSRTSHQGCWLWCHGFGTQTISGFRSRRGLFDSQSLWRCRHHPCSVSTRMKREARPPWWSRKWMASRLLF